MFEEPVERTIAKLAENIKTDSTNSCEIISCRFGAQYYEKEKKTIKMTDVLLKAVEYAYSQNEKAFERFVEELKEESQGRHTFFYSKRKSVRSILGGKYQIDTGYNNDQKIKFIYQIFQRLNIEMDDVVLKLRFAREK